MDKIIRAITKDGMVKATAITSRDLTERARQIHKTLPVATAALGRTLAACSMMGNALKEAGFDDVTVTGDLTSRPPAPEEDRWIFRCRKAVNS